MTAPRFIRRNTKKALAERGPSIHDEHREACLGFLFVLTVGLIDSVKSAGAAVQEFKEDFVEAIEHMNALVEE